MIDFSAALAAYALAQPIHVMPMTEVGRNNQLWAVKSGSAHYVLKQHTSSSYEDRDSIAYEYCTLSLLAQGGLSFALPVPILTLQGEAVCETDEGCFSLAQRLPGERLKASEQTRAFGAALGELHAALEDLPMESRPGRPLFERLFAFPAPHDVMNLTPESLHIADEPSVRELLAWWQDEAQALEAFVAGPYRLLPWQMCHNDFTPNNVLVDQGRVSAVLDFEFMSPAARALDVAMALRMTMKIWETPEPWQIVKEFFAGYQSWNHLTEAEIAALPWLLRLRSSVSILWWVGRQQGLARVPSLIENQQTMVQWLSQFERPFLDCVAGA
jgi:homoserine kinase type II